MTAGPVMGVGKARVKHVKCATEKARRHVARVEEAAKSRRPRSRTRDIPM